MLKYKSPIKYIIKGRPVKVYDQPTSSSNIINALPPETTVIGIEEENGYIRLYENGGYILKTNRIIVDRQSMAQQIIDEKLKESKSRKMIETKLNMPASTPGSSYDPTDNEPAYTPKSNPTSTTNGDKNSDITQKLKDFTVTVGSIFSGEKLIDLIGYDHDIDNSKFKIQNIRSVFGFPYQFEPDVDNRLNGDLYDVGAFGRKFSQKIVSRAPVMIMQAGVPDFLKGFSDEQKKGVVGDLADAIGKLTNASTTDEVANQAGKYYAFKDASVAYFDAVNDMCRAVGSMMGIGSRHINVNGVDGPIFNFNWLDSAAAGGGSHSFFGYYRNAVAFYINAEPQMQDSFNNGSRQSQLAGKVNQLSDQAAELQFILGGADGMGIPLAGVLYKDQTEVANNAGSKDGGTTGVLGTLMDRIDTLMSGGRLIFPEIWSDSSFTKNYNITIKLDSPDCDPVSIYLNIFVPLCHIIGFCMPRWSAPNAYVSPFIVRAYFRSMFHVDMGIITSCEITRGTQQGWTQDGLPTEVTVNLTIKDLYNVLSMTAAGGFKDIIANPAQLDYLGNMCGINVAVPDFSRTLTLWASLRNPSTALSDTILRTQSRLAGAINNRWESLFNKYWRIGGSGR